MQSLRAMDPWLCDLRFSGNDVFFRVSDDRGDKEADMLVIAPPGKRVILDHYSDEG